MSNEISDMQLLQLSQCATTSKYGLIDKGNPRAYKILAASGMVKLEGPTGEEGYIITTLGLETLKLNKDKIFGRRKKPKKKKWQKDEDRNEEE